MTAPLITLDYDNADFPFQAASAQVRRQSLPKWVQILCILIIVFMLVPVLMAALPPDGNMFTAPAIPAWCFLIGYLAYLQFNKSFARKVFAQIASAPYRQGPRHLILDSRGVTVTSPTSHWHYPWSHIQGFEAGPQGSAMIVLGPYDFEPISAAAFAGPAGRGAFIATATQQRWAAEKAVA